MKIYIATSNQHKVKEVAAILSKVGCETLQHPDYANLNVEETGSTFEENASIKALELSKLVDGYVIADDSGVCVDYLDGAPGIYSARFAGVNAKDEDNNKLMLAKLAGVPLEKRTAAYVAVIALSYKGKIVATFRGECSGFIAQHPKGDGGFGYDPIFILPDGRHMAEYSPEEKNRISHRNKALQKLSAFIGKGIKSED